MEKNLTGVSLPHSIIPFPASWERPFQENVYRLDQELARRSIPYFAREGEGWADLDVVVSERHAKTVREIIRCLTRRFSEKQSRIVR